jgi:hypothetical protein
VNEKRQAIRGVRIVESPPVLRHFSARLEPAAGSLLAEPAAAKRGEPA